YAYASGNRYKATPAKGTAITYTFDEAHRLTATNGGATYTYDGDGLRQTKNVNGYTTAYTWDVSGRLPMLLYDGTNRYVYGPDGRPIEQIADGGGCNGQTSTYYFHDTQGSTRVLADASGTVVGTYAFEAYGAQATHGGTATTPFRYSGEYTDDETG